MEPTAADAGGTSWRPGVFMTAVVCQPVRHATRALPATTVVCPLLGERRSEPLERGRLVPSWYPSAWRSSDFDRRRRESTGFVP